MAISREGIISALVAALEPLEYVNAMWLAGSTATGTEDRLSDIDALLDVADGRQEEALAAVEAALEELAPIAYRYRVPEPAWHGHSQCLYRLRGCPEHLMVDLAVMQRGSAAPRLDEREIHGEPVVVFDKLGVVKAVPLDRQAHPARVAAYVAMQRERFFLLRHLAEKELVRGNAVSALSRYNAFVLPALVAALRARHCPVFHEFGARYLERHLPAEVYERYLRLAFVADPDDLERKLREAVAWATEEFAALEAMAGAGTDAGPETGPGTDAGT